MLALWKPLSLSHTHTHTHTHADALDAALFQVKSSTGAWRNCNPVCRLRRSGVSVINIFKAPSCSLSKGYKSLTVSSCIFCAYQSASFADPLFVLFVLLLLLARSVIGVINVMSTIVIRFC
jgi:hypothetical protein